MNQTIAEQFTLADLRAVRRRLHLTLEAIDAAELTLLHHSDPYWTQVYAARVFDYLTVAGDQAARLVTVVKGAA